MFAKLSISPEGLRSEDQERLARELEGHLIATGGVTLGSVPVTTATGHRGEPVTITVGTLILAAVTSGTVTALFNILKSYVERGVDFTFEGTKTSGEPVKIGMKNVKLSEFRALLAEIGILK